MFSGWPETAGQALSSLSAHGSSGLAVGALSGARACFSVPASLQVTSCSIAPGYWLPSLCVGCEFIQQSLQLRLVLHAFKYRGFKAAGVFEVLLCAFLLIGWQDSVLRLSASTVPCAGVSVAWAAVATQLG